MHTKSIKVVSLLAVVRGLDIQVIEEFVGWCRKDLGWSFGTADFSLFHASIVADRARVFSLLSLRDDVMDQMIERIEKLDVFIDFVG